MSRIYDCSDNKLPVFTRHPLSGLPIVINEQYRAILSKPGFVRLGDSRRKGIEMRSNLLTDLLDQDVLVI
jgi:hypothetical protein